VGVDFLKRVKPTIEKSVDNYRLALGTADLFTRKPVSTARTALVELTTESALSEGDQILIEAVDDGFIATKDGQLLGIFFNLPDQLAAGIDSSCGAALGEIERIYKFSKTAEVTVS